MPRGFSHRAHTTWCGNILSSDNSGALYDFSKCSACTFYEEMMHCLDFGQHDHMYTHEKQSDSLRAVAKNMIYAPSPCSLLCSFLQHEKQSDSLRGIAKTEPGAMYAPSPGSLLKHEKQSGSLRGVAKTDPRAKKLSLSLPLSLL